jgi:hypothetical protein
MSGGGPLDRSQVRSTTSEIRNRIWQWDPVALVDFGVPDDEYDCLIEPVTAGLRDGLSDQELADKLDAFIEEHFGQEPPRNTHAFVQEIGAWYRSRLS